MFYLMSFVSYTHIYSLQLLQQITRKVTQTIARDIEAYLYRSAVSFDAYLDIRTLKRRLHQAMRMLGVNHEAETPVVLTDEEKNNCELSKIFLVILMK